MIGSPITDEMIVNCIGDHKFEDRSQPCPSIIMQPTYCHTSAIQMTVMTPSRPRRSVPRVWHLPIAENKWQYYWTVQKSRYWLLCRKMAWELCNSFTLLEETSLSITQPVAIIVSCGACNAALAMLSVSTLKLVHLVSNTNASGESIHLLG